MSSAHKENTTTRLTAAQSKQDEEGAMQALESMKKPFVEPTVSVPFDVLEATAFFQGSAALGIGDLP